MPYRPNPNARRWTSIECTIERRLLVNYRIDPELVTRLLPSPLEPQVIGKWAVGGVCFLRLTHLRPSGVFAELGISSENVAHRFAVEWQGSDGRRRSGVYVPRRDTGSRFVASGGGRVFPGAHHFAHFAVTGSGTSLAISVRSADSAVRLQAETEVTADLESELFNGVGQALEFFREGCTGYSPRRREGLLDCVTLECSRWDAEPARILKMESSLFDDASLFPPGTTAVDSALVMRGLPCRWRAGEPLAVLTPPTVAPLVA